MLARVLERSVANVVVYGNALVVRLISDVLDAPPGTLPADDLGLEEADDGLSQGVVVGVAPAPDGRLDARFREALGVADRQILNAAI